MYLKRLLLIIIGLLILQGCQSPPSNDLTVSFNLAEEEWQVFRQDVFPPFEKRYGIQIKAYQIEAEQLISQLEAMAPTERSEIDVFAQDNMSLAPLVNKNLVKDLTPYKDKQSDQILPALLDSGRFNDKFYFYPFRPNVQIAYYNDQAFKKYNLAPPRTWAELRQVAETFHQKEGIGRVLFKGYGGNPTATQIYEMIIQAGGDPYAFNDEGCIKAFRFLQELQPYLSPETKRAKWDTTNDILAHQEAYLAANWPFGIVILIKDYNLDFIKTYSGWSGPAGEYHVVGGDVFGIPRFSKKGDLALKFIAYMQSKATQEILVGRLGWPSIRQDAYGQLPDWQKPHFASIQSALQRGVFRPNIAWWPAFNKYINLAFQEIVLQGADVEKVLNHYKAELEKEKIK